jgi:hypothetical protein
MHKLVSTVETWPMRQTGLTVEFAMYHASCVRTTQPGEHTATAVAITYQSGPRKSDLRTVICEDVHSTVVLLPQGSLDIVQATLVCGTTSRCDFWAEELGLPDAHDFAAPADKIVQTRPIQIAAIVRRHK